MKKVYCVIVIIGLVCGGILSSFINESSIKIHLKQAYKADSTEQLIEDSNEIIIGTVTKGYKEIKKDDITFTLTKVKVVEVVAGSDIKKGDEITLLQTKSYEDEVISKGTKLLFLEKYYGSICNEGYISKGLYQGQYDIVNGRIKTSNKNLSDIVTNSISMTTLVDLKYKITKTKK